MCLPASLLGFGCAVNEQCTLKVPNSQCVDGVCKCNSNFTPIRRDKCLPPAKLDEFCLNSEMCMMENEYLYCKWIIPRIYGKCKCPHNYLINDGQCLPNNTIDVLETTTIDAREDNDSSISMVSLGKRCKSSIECRIRDPFSTCVNGVCECMVKTDECSTTKRGCYNDTFQCRNGKCISWYFVCDKVMNCDDGSDEDECFRYNCPKEAFQCNDGTCLSRGSVCNGRWECPDGSDEA
ncbi:low-density lipoprotein receptor-related protein 8-like protein, partial [Leptotrombidium deliense]